MPVLTRLLRAQHRPSGFHDVWSLDDTSVGFRSRWPLRCKLAHFQFDTFDWHAAATVATWLMTLFIQRAEHRDTQAIHAKLDELLRVEGEARNELTQLDQKEPEEIEEHRQVEWSLQ